MKAIVSILFLLAGTYAQAATPVSIHQFSNKAAPSACRYQYEWWGQHLGTGFQEMLAKELLESGKVEVLEREVIHSIYNDEHNLVNSEADTTLEKGQFKKAKYVIAGAVTEFEYCAEKKGGSVNIGAVAAFLGGSAPDISVGFGTAKAKLAMDLRLIDARTGKVIKTVRAEGTAEDSRWDLDANLGDFYSQDSSPMGQAARTAIREGSRRLLEHL